MLHRKFSLAPSFVDRGLDPKIMLCEVLTLMLALATRISADDVGAVVGDIGSYSCKLGFAGEDLPRAYFTSLVGRTVDPEATKRLEAELDAAQDYSGSARSGGIGGGFGSNKGKAALKGKRGEKGRATGISGGQQLSSGGGGGAGMGGGGSSAGGSAGGDNPADGEDGNVVYRWHVDSLMSGIDMDALPVMEEGIVTNWDLLEKLWEHGAETRLKVKLSDHPVLLSEKPFNDSKSRMKYTEIMFEKFDVPAEFMSKDAVLASFSIGRTTAALADVGGDTMVVTPVVDGWVESKGIVKSLLGSNALQRYYLHLLDQSRKGTPIPPLPTRMLQALGGKLRPSLAERLRMDLARDMMTLAARTSDTPFEDNSSQFANIPAVPFQLPDGTEVGIGTDRFRIPELLLNTDPLTDALDKGKTCPPGLKKLAESLDRPGFTIRPLQGAVVDSVLACEREQQSSLFNGVVLAGGGCCFEGLTERVKMEIEGSLEVPNSGWRVKVLAAGSNERKISTWLGGSILGSLGSFHEMWLSKPEYHEHGAQMIDKKCP